MNDEEMRNLLRLAEKLKSATERMSGERATVSFKEFAEEYKSKKMKDPTLRQSTKNLFENQVGLHLIPAFGHLPIDQVGASVFYDWMSKQNRLTRFFNARKCLIEILRAAKEEGHLDKTPKIENPDKPRKVGRVVSDEEVLKILWKASKPFRFIFYCFWRHGYRPGEILKWEWDMLDLDGPDATWVNVPARISKNDRSRRAPLDNVVARLLRIRKRKGNGSIFVFPSRNSLSERQASYASAWSLACSKAGVAKCVPYDFRRTFITERAIDNKANIYVAKILDTSTEMMERVYVKEQEDVMSDIVNYKRNKENKKEERGGGALPFINMKSTAQE